MPGPPDAEMGVADVCTVCLYDKRGKMKLKMVNGRVVYSKSAHGFFMRLRARVGGFLR